MAEPIPMPKPAPKAQHFAEKRDWPGYFGVVLGKPARETLLSALERFEREPKTDSPRAPETEPPLAIDLGCGEGRDTLELLRRGWRVRAIDSHPMAFDLLLPRVPTEQRERLTVRAAAFEGLDLPAARLVNASFSLPFCEPAHFDALWSRIVAAVEPGGRFCGQLFGDRDSWATIPDRSHQTEQRARDMFAAFDIEEFRAEEKDDNDALGNPKHWHVFHVVARRR
ncbi:MAG: class I SAM-dependent methyltransferase [Phycisphaeraceae bacterium]|nr:class I SAM-dependent methyltransferase [Phycisphaeraceae bacterium]